jgi:hypothetical protein
MRSTSGSAAPRGSPARLELPADLAVALMGPAGRRSRVAVGSREAEEV